MIKIHELNYIVNFTSSSFPFEIVHFNLSILLPAEEIAAHVIINLIFHGFEQLLIKNLRFLLYLLLDLRGIFTPRFILPQGTGLTFYTLLIDWRSSFCFVWQSQNFCFLLSFSFIFLHLFLLFIENCKSFHL